MCYGGHQFGQWAGQLGDGRAINLGEVKTQAGRYWTLQLKGGVQRRIRVSPMDWLSCARRCGSFFVAKRCII